MSGRSEFKARRESLRDFLDMGCDIIVCASRSYGETCENIKGLKKHGYQVVWTQNDRTDDETMYDYLNRKYAERVVEMIERSTTKNLLYFFGVSKKKCNFVAG